MNFIPDTNPFKLAGPPRWWLKQLNDFDETLVVVPSRQGFFYRLAQRKRLSLPEKMTNDLLWQESDTKMLASYGLIPVTTILATANWSNPFLFEELRRRSPHRMGGAEKVTNDVETAEREASLKKQVEIDERNTFIAKDAWKLYLKKLGLRSHMWSPKTSTPVTEKLDRAPAIKIAAH